MSARFQGDIGKSSKRSSLLENPKRNEGGSVSPVVLGYHHRAVPIFGAWSEKDPDPRRDGEEYQRETSSGTCVAILPWVAVFDRVPDARIVSPYTIFATTMQGCQTNPMTQPQDGKGFASSFRDLKRGGGMSYILDAGYKIPVSTTLTPVLPLIPLTLHRICTESELRRATSAISIC